MVLDHTRDIIVDYTKPTLSIHTGTVQGLHCIHTSCFMVHADDVRALKILQFLPVCHLLKNLRASVCRANNKIMLIKHYNNA